MGIFSLPIKKPPLGLPWTITTNILDPLGVHFFCRKLPLIQTLGQSPSAEALKKMRSAAQMEAM